jgi:hypothetical protein
MTKLSDIKNNPIIKSILLIIIVLYTTMAAPRMSPSVLKVLQYPVVKIFCLFLILYFANVNPLYALVSSVILFVTLQILRDYETAMHIKHNNPTEVPQYNNTVYASATTPAQPTDNLNEDQNEDVYNKSKIQRNLIHTHALNEIENLKQLEIHATNQNNTNEADKHKNKIFIYEKVIDTLNKIDIFQKENEYSNNTDNKQYISDVIATHLTMVDAYMKYLNHNEALYEENIQTNTDKSHYHEIEKNKMDIITNASDIKLKYLNKLNNAIIDNNIDVIKNIEGPLLKINMKINALMNSSILKEDSFKAKMNGDDENANKLYRDSIIQELKAKSIINSDYLNNVANQLLTNGDKVSAQQFINDSNNELVVVGTIERCEQHYNSARNAEQLGDEEAYKIHMDEYNKLQCKINDEYIINYNNDDFMNADNKYVSVANHILSGNAPNPDVKNSCNLTDNEHSNNLVNITGYSTNNNYALVN